MVEPITVLEPILFDDTDAPEYAPKLKLPDGFYNVMIEHLQIGSKKDARTICLTYVILDGDWKGKKIMDFYNPYLSSTGASRFKFLLQILGFNKFEIKEIGMNINALLEVIVGLKMRIRTQFKDDFVQVSARMVPVAPHTNGTDILNRFKEKQALLQKTTTPKGMW